MTTPTEEFIIQLAKLKAGDLGLLRVQAGNELDESIEGFDLFTGIWWPLRQKHEFAPRRGVAWTIAKLYAARPIEHAAGPDFALAVQLREISPHDPKARQRFQDKFDRLLTTPLDQIEPIIREALNAIADRRFKLDWVQLTDDLARWESEATRLKWAGQFLQTERSESC